MKYIAQVSLNQSARGAVVTLVRSTDFAPLLVDGEPVEVEVDHEFVDRCLSPSYLDGLERRIKAVEEDQERLARIEARDALEYERLRAKFAVRDGAAGNETAPPTCTPRDVLKSLGGTASFVRVTNDGTGERVAEVDMGPAGKATIRIEADDTTETLVAKVRAAFAPKEEQEQHGAETRCEVCSRVINVGDDVLFCSEDDTVQHTRCSGLTNARGTPWMG